MAELFLTVLNMSISAALIAVAVLLVRYCIFTYDIPKYLRCLLWVFVAFRLLCPFTVETSISMMPKAETIPAEVILSDTPSLNHISSPADAVSSIIAGDFGASTHGGNTLGETILTTGAVIWAIGIAIMIICAAVSYIRLTLTVRASVPATEKGVYICDNVSSPFILGIFSPKIYLPSSLSDENTEYILHHEKAHIKRLDHLWKPMGYLLLSIHWFNPVIWAAYVFFCRDIELACDEKVVSKMDANEKKQYSHILLDFSTKGSSVSACPLAFGEVGIKSRVKSILSYKKTTVFAVIAFAVAILIICINFLTSSPAKPSLPNEISDITSGGDHSKVEIDLVAADLDTAYPYIDIKWKNKTADPITFGESYKISRMENGKWVSVYDPEIVPAIGYSAPPAVPTTHRYSAFCIEKSGTYRFEADFFFDKDHKEKYSVWCEFDVTEDIVNSTVQEYEKASVAFSADRVDNSAETGDTVKLSANPFGFFVSEGGAEYDVQETVSSDNLKKLLSKCHSPQSMHSASGILSENKRIWEGIYTENSAEDATIHLVFIFEQNDGTMYLAKGYCIDVTEDIIYPQNAAIESIFLLSEK